MALLTATGVEKSIAERAILRGCDLVVEPGERIGLVGINGCGKSTFLSIISGSEPPDNGQIRLGKSVRMGFLAQEPVLEGETVADAARAVTAWHQTLLDDYQKSLDEHDIERSGELLTQLEHHGWQVDHRTEAMLHRLGAPEETARIEHLSGGELRRTALALTLLGSPDLLLLDEPTNHLDADTTEWLQGWLNSYNGAVILVTHDRYLLEAVATRIVEIEDGVCVSYSGSYGDYLIDRAERQAMLSRGQDRRLALIAREAAWAVRSPAARTTKQKGRLKRLEDLTNERKIPVERGFDLDLSTNQKQGKTLLELRAVSKSFDKLCVLDNVSFSLRPGDRLGITGPNGAGKSTLLKLLVKRLKPDHGDIFRGPRVKVALFDQERSGLEAGDSVFDAAGGGNNHVFVGDNPIHVAGFLERFMFDRSKFEQKVSSLSGGERARLLLAKLLLKGSNLILLDEPTNDLDLRTLRILEEALLAFDGACIIVTHDRAFLDRTCTQVLASHGNGRWVMYAERMQYLRAKAKEEKQNAKAESAPKKGKKIKEKKKQEQAPKLSVGERKELKKLPAKLEALEAELEQVNADLADPELYKSRAAEVPAINKLRLDIKAQIDAAFERWAELDAKA